MMLKGSLVALLMSALLILCGVGGKVPKNNCTLQSDSDCVNKCEDGYYLMLRARLAHSCFPCQKCCNDSEDKKAEECADYPNKCQIRSPAAGSCPTSNTMPRNTTSGSQESSTATDLERAQQRASLTTETTAVRTVHTKNDSIAPPTSSENKPYKEEIINNISIENKNSSGSMILVIIITVAIVFLLFVVVFLVWDKLNPRRNPARNNDVDITSSNLELPSFEMRPASGSTSGEQLNQGNLTLEELEHKHLEALEWMCMRLDNGPRQDFESLSSKYPMVTLDQRRSLQNEFKNSGGSPSKALVKHLQVLYPSLTVSDFLKSLTEIRRNDIALGLQQRLENESSTVV